MSEVGAATARLAQVQDPQPLSQSKLKNFVASAGSLKKAEQTFLRSVHGVTGPPSADNVFPDKVDYPSQCGAICEDMLGEGLISKMYRSLLENFTSIAARFKTPAKLAEADLLLVFEVGCFGVQHPDDRHIFAFLPSASYRSGNVKPTQTFTMLDAVSDVKATGVEPFANLQLRLAHKPRIAPSPEAVRPPLDCQPVGRFQHLMEERLAKRLVQLFGDLRTVSRITIQALCYEDVSVETVRVRSIDQGFEMITINARGCDPPQPADAAGQQPGPGRPTVDLLRTMSEPAYKQRMRRVAGGGARPGQRHRRGASGASQSSNSDPLVVLGMCVAGEPDHDLLGALFGGDNDDDTVAADSGLQQAAELAAILVEGEGAGTYLQLRSRNRALRDILNDSREYCSHSVDPRVPRVVFWDDESESRSQSQCQRRAKV